MIVKLGDFGMRSRFLECTRLVELYTSTHWHWVLDLIDDLAASSFIVHVIWFNLIKFECMRWHGCCQYHSGLVKQGICTTHLRHIFITQEVDRYNMSNSRQVSGREAQCGESYGIVEYWATVYEMAVQRLQSYIRDQCWSQVLSVPSFVLHPWMAPSPVALILLEIPLWQSTVSTNRSLSKCRIPVYLNFRNQLWGKQWWTDNSVYTYAYSL